MVAARKWTAEGVADRLAHWRGQVERAARFWTDAEVDAQATRLFARATPLAEKERILAGLSVHAGPRAVVALRAYLAEPDVGLEDLARVALESAQAEVDAGASLGRNSPCPCASGLKWKHCCAQEDDAWNEQRQRGRGREIVDLSWTAVSAASRRR